MDRKSTWDMINIKREIFFAIGKARYFVCTSILWELKRGPPVRSKVNGMTNGMEDHGQIDSLRKMNTFIVFHSFLNAFSHINFDTSHSF